MENQLVFLANTPYEVFPLQKVLRPFGGFGPEIDLGGLPVRNHLYVFVYNKVAKAVEKHLVPDRMADYEQITLPLSAVEKIGPLPKEHIGVLNALSRKGNWGIYFGDEYMLGYLRGKPVELEFAGESYTLDVNREIYYQSNNPDNIIRLSDLPCSDIGYELRYDPVLKNIAQGAGDGMPLYFLDQMVEYDPLGIARRHNISIGRLPELDEYLKDPGVLQKCRDFKGTILPGKSTSQEKNKAPKKSGGIRR